MHRKFIYYCKPFFRFDSDTSICELYEGDLSVHGLETQAPVLLLTDA